MYSHDRAVSLVEEAANWAVNSKEIEGIRDKLEPLARYLTEVSGAMMSEVLIAVAKALEAGFYYGKYGFPEDRVPKAFKNALEEEENGK
jgi:hypothetical protein